MNLDLEKKRLCENVTARLIIENQSISLAEIQQKRVPKFLLSYLRTLVRRIYYDVNPVKVKPSGHYPLKSALIHQKLDELTALVQAETLFFPDELKIAIEDSVSLQFNFIVNPVKTLTRLFFNSRTVRGREELTTGIKGIADKRWLFPLLIKSMENHPGETVSLAEFKKYLDEAQKNAYFHDAIEAFRADVEAFLELWKSVDTAAEYDLEPETVLTLLRVRKLSDLITVFEKKVKSIDVFEPEAFLNKFSEFFTPENEPEITAIPVYETEIFVDEIVTDDENESVETNAFPETAKEEIAENPELENVENRIEDTVSSTYGEGVSQSKSSAILAENLPDLNDLLDSRTRKLIVKKIFNRKESEFSDFITQIHNSPDWKTARVVLENELKKRNVEPVSREAIKLGDWIFERYFPNQRNIS